MNAMIVMSLFVATADPAKPDEKIQESLLGEWTFEKMTEHEQDVTAKVKKDLKIKIAKDKFIINIVGKDAEYTYTIDTAKKPMQMDLFKDKKLDDQCIFEIDGDTLRISPSGKKGVKGSDELVVADRRTKIDPDNLWILKRVKK